MSDWIILRTSGRTTLKLAETLAEDGFEVWTPKEEKTFKKSRSNTRVKATLPIMPGYVFARRAQWLELLQLSRMEVKPRRGLGWGKPAHASFSLMREGDLFAIVADAHLQGLRSIEAKRAPKRKAEQPLLKGATVRVLEGGGSFTGMKGVVRRSKTGTTVLLIDSRIKVELPTFLLREDELRVDIVAARLAA